MKDKLKKVIVMILAVVFICSIAAIAWHYMVQHLENQVDKQVAGLVTDTPSPTPTPTPEETPEPTATPVPQVLDKYAALVEQNPDTVGWLKIEGTAIDYVVMHTPDEPEKYLEIDFYGNYSNRGTLFMDAKCDIWSSENLIIYGHHMASSAMFGNLDYFAGESYWEEHKYIQFDTIYEEQTYEIVAAFYSRILYKDEEGFRYYQFIEADDEAAFSEYADFIEENQCYDTGVDIQCGDRLLTLSTCSYQVENGRFAVVAKLISDDDGGGASPAENTTTPIAETEVREISSELVYIADDEIPLSSPSKVHTQSFSTEMILIALCLVLFGTAVMATAGKES